MFDDFQEEKSREELLAETPADIRDEAEQLLRDQDLLSKVLEMVRALGVAGERELILTLYLVGTSRLLRSHCAAYVQGPSSSGKSHIIDTLASLFPPESVLQATDMTDNAVFYMPPGTLKHCFVVAGERTRRKADDTARGTKALREILASGRLSKSVPVPNPVTGQPETRLIEQEGPIAYVESTTELNLFEEDANRCILVSTDEQPEQTRRIISVAARSAAGLVPSIDRQRVLHVAQTVQRLLESRAVIIPYAVALQQHFPNTPVEVRRAFLQVLGMIRASALLFQQQREIDANGAIVATLDDYRLARQLLAGPIARSLGGELSDAVKRFFERLRAELHESFTAVEASKIVKVCDRTARDYLKALQAHGAVVLVNPSRGPIAARWAVNHDVSIAAVSDSILPDVDSLEGMSEMPAFSSIADSSDVPF